DGLRRVDPAAAARSRGYVGGRSRARAPRVPAAAERGLLPARHPQRGVHHRGEPEPAAVAEDKPHPPAVHGLEVVGGPHGGVVDGASARSTRGVSTGSLSSAFSGVSGAARGTGSSSGSMVYVWSSFPMRISSFLPRSFKRWEANARDRRPGTGDP